LEVVPDRGYGPKRAGARKSDVHSVVKLTLEAESDIPLIAVGEGDGGPTAVR
jgi:hypothetical protein